MTITALAFADAFDLKPETAREIKRRWRGVSTLELFERGGAELDDFCNAIIHGCREPKTLKRIGRSMLPDYAYSFAEMTFQHGGVDCPYAVEIWAKGEPVRDRETTGYVDVAAIYLNRTPGLISTALTGTVSPHARTFRLAVGDAPISLCEATGGPCSFEIVISILAPTLPLVSHGKAVSFIPFAHGIAAALQQVLPKAYVKPLLSLAESRREERQAAAENRAEETAEKQRQRAEEAAEKAARQRERNAKRAAEAGKLNAILAEEKDRTGLGLGMLTVMGPRDPYRIGERAEAHTIGRWLRQTIDALRGSSAWQPMHIRGLHYQILSRANILKPDGSVYGASPDDWAWLQNEAAKAARWLSYVPWSWLRDQRSANAASKAAAEPAAVGGEPSLDRFSAHAPDIEMPSSPADISYSVGTRFPRPRNEYHLVVTGEKSALSSVINQTAHRFFADTYCPAGEISDTHLAEIAAEAILDGRELILLVIGDCDPAGRQMAISIGHKLRALRDLNFPALRYRVIPLALEPEQAKSSKLPQSKLKDSEKRSKRWRETFGIEQVEIDAAVELRPGMLTGLLAKAARTFIDPSIADRCAAANNKWQEAIRPIVEAEVEGQEEIKRLRAECDAAYLEVVMAIDTYRQSRTALVEGLNAIEIDLDALPEPPMVPEIMLDVDNRPAPLVTSEMTLAEHVAALKARKNYGRGDAETGGGDDD